MNTLCQKRLWLSRLAILLVIASTVAGCSKGPEGKAQELMDAGMYDQARVVLSAAITKDPTDAKLHFMLGKVYLGSHDIPDAQASFDNATRLDADYGSEIGKTYYDQAVADQNESERDNLFQYAAHYDPSYRPKVGDFYKNLALGHLDDPIDVTDRYATSAISYDPGAAAEISEAILTKAPGESQDSWPFQRLTAAKALSIRLAPGSSGDWAKLFYDRLTAIGQNGDPSAILQFGDAVVSLDSSRVDAVAGFYLDSARNKLQTSPSDYHAATELLQQAANLQPSLSHQIADLAWSKVQHDLSNLKKLGQQAFSELFGICETRGTSESIGNSPDYRYARALKLWVDGSKSAAIQLLGEIASSAPPNSIAAIQARKLLAPPPAGKRLLENSQWWHFATWGFGPSGGKGIDIRPISIEIGQESIKLSFSVKSGNWQDLLLYSPTNNGACETLYLTDDVGGKFPSTTGWVGGRQSEFNSCATKVMFEPNEEVTLSSTFPMVSRGATAITLQSPDPDKAGHQGSWYWQNIGIKSGPFD